MLFEQIRMRYFFRIVLVVCLLLFWINPSERPQAATPFKTTGPTIRIADAKVTEDDKVSVNAVFTLTLSAPSKLSVSVAYATADGTAAAGSDYTATSGT